MRELFGKIEVRRLSGMVNIVAGRPSGDLQAKTVTPTREQQIVTPDKGFSALSRVTVEGVTLQNKTVKPGSSAQVVQADDGSTGLGIITVEAAPLQEITAEIAAEIQHLTPAAGFYGFSGVTIKALPDAETAAFCENTELPAIPAAVLEAYPYAVIVETDSSGTTMYLLAAAESAFFYGPGSAIGQSYDKFMGSLGAGTTYYTTAEGASWTKIDDVTAGNMVAEMAETSRLVYANHDIYQVEADDSGNLSMGTLYYAKSGLYGVALSDAYRIQRETLEDLGDQVNRLTDTAESMTPGRMAQKLEGLDFQLQEAHVYPTTEVQTITPDAGYYGFSKITVEAVEDSGGGDGGDGGGTGDDSTQNGDGISFGYDFTEVPEESDEEEYGAYVLPASPLSLPYQVMQRADDGTVSANAADAPYTCYMVGSTPNLVAYPSRTEHSVYDPDTGKWSDVEIHTNVASSTVVVMWTLIYSSTNIPNTNGDVYFKKTNNTKFVNGNYVGAAVERDGTYAIDGATLNEIGGSVQKLTGTTEPMTPSEMAAALANIPVIEATYPDAEEEVF